MTRKKQPKGNAVDLMRELQRVCESWGLGDEDTVTALLGAAIRKSKATRFKDFFKHHNIGHDAAKPN